MEFKVGDIIKGKNDNSYTITNENMHKAKVIKTNYDGDNEIMEIKILEHKYNKEVNSTYRVKNTSKKFELVKEHGIMNKFRVGDKVKLARIEDEASYYTNRIGKIGKILDACDDHAQVEWDDKEGGPARYPYYKNLELVQDELTLSDIKERYLVTFRNGKEAYVKGYASSTPNFVCIYNGKTTSEEQPIEGYNEDLTNKHDKQWDIVAVHKPHYDTIWTRTEETVKELTLAEIEDKFGCKVKIVKE